MASQKRKLQTRQSRSSRMRSATVKRALTAQSDGSPPEPKNRFAKSVDPTSALDAVLDGLPAGAQHPVLRELGLLVGIMAVTTIVIMLLMRGDDRSMLTPATVTLVWIMGAVTAGLSIVLYLRRWRHSRLVLARRSAGERRYLTATGPLRIQERNEGFGRRQHWLRVAGGDWMPMDSPLIEALGPTMVERPAIELSGNLRDGHDVEHEWTVRSSTILYHRASGTVVEVHDHDGTLVYRHPRYHPDA